jgi:hypothetical protein
MAKTIHVRAFITLPRLPNFLLCEGGGSMDVADITDESIKEIGQQWTEALLAHAQERRNKQKLERANGGDSNV